MKSVHHVVVVASVFGLLLVGCPPNNPAEGEGDEGEGEEGEGEGDPGEGEGEGDPGEGEGEGERGEGEGEGEGDPGEGEGEGEGGPGSTCQRDGDCGGADVCNFADPFNTDFITDGQCSAVQAGLPAGSACAGGGTCDRGSCLRGLCTKLCEQTADCPNAMICQGNSFSLVNGPGPGGVAPICVADPALPDTACDNDADCTSTNRVCNELVGDQDFTLECGAPGSGAAFAGACTSASFSSRGACQTGLCDGDVAGMCTKPCASTADCGGGLICSGEIFSNVAGDYCAEPCITDTQCDVVGGRFCTVRENAASNALDTICANPQGAKVFGDAAASGLECQTGLEFADTCTRLCDSGGCAAPLPNCTAVTFPRPGGGDQAVNLCIN